MLLGRERESSQIDLLIERARARVSSALVIRGDPGIGKSALVGYAIDRATGMHVLRATGVRSESELPFAAVHELLRPALDHLDRLPEPQRTALRGALALSPPVSADRLAVNAAVLAVLAEAAEPKSLLCVIDDAHWLDAASAEALLFCARRLHSEGVLMLMAARDNEWRPFDTPGIPELVLEGLDHSASLELVHRGSVPLAPKVVEQLIDVTRGNPLALIELPAELSADQRTGRETLGEPLPVGKGIRRAFLGRVQALSDRTQTSLVVAAASDAPDLRTIGAALEGLGARVSDLEEAERAGLIAIVDGNVVFHHPLVRSAIYRTADPTVRRAAHRAFAEVRRSNVGSRAWHLSAAATGPDEETAAALDDAGHDASARGAPAVAGWNYARASLFSQSDEGRARRSLAAGTAYWLAGRSVQSLECLDAALAATCDPRTRADIQLLRGHALIWSSNVLDAADTLTAEALRVAAIDRDRAALMMATASMPCAMAGQNVRAVETARRAVEFAGEGPARVLARAMLSISTTVRGESTAHASLIESQRELAAADSPALSQLSGVVAHVLMYVEEYESSRTMLDRIIAARTLGLNPHALAARADLEFRVGRWPESYADAAESVDLAREVGQVSMLPFCLGTLARVEAATGRDRDSVHHAEQALAMIQPLGLGSAETLVRCVQGFTELGRGRPEATVERLKHVAETTEIINPGVEPWAPDLIEAYVRVGLVAEATDALEDLTARARMTGHVGAYAAARRCRGLLGGDNEFAAAFEESLDGHRRTPTPFELARTELCYGERLRRAGRRTDAREQLRAALETFESLGAEPWAERARVELRATGERVRKREESTAARLTAQELQVAMLVAEGGTNREVGARLMLSPRTIEFHLRNVYAKLGVRSRTELASRLAGKAATAITTVLIAVQTSVIEEGLALALIS